MAAVAVVPVTVVVGLVVAPAAAALVADPVVAPVAGPAHLLWSLHLRPVARVMVVPRPRL